ncbi:MAG: hypothetical protein H7Y32_09600 [Chloroflexales bacterium]|nr:hypothetical protein [Chloroflexales bacterium]
MRDAFARLGGLIEAGIAAGKAGEHGEELLEQLGDAQQALEDGDQQQATNTLRAMQQTLLKGVGKDEIAPDFAQQVLRELELLAARAGAALRVAEGGGNDA